MKCVSNLVALPAESDVAQRPPAQMRVEPVGEDPLLGRAELSGSGQHAATVDPDRKTKASSRIPAP